MEDGVLGAAAEDRNGNKTLVTNRVQFAWKACVVVALAADCAPLLGELKPEEIYEAVVPSVMTLEVENAEGERFVGSAFLTTLDHVAVTAWHVIHDAARVEARFSDGQRVPVLGVVDKDEAKDVALIKLAPVPRGKIPVSADRARIGSRIYVIGAPKGFDFSMAGGLISQIREVDSVQYYQVSCPISPGDSGGPVLNDQGTVIAVMSWRKANAQNLSFAVPVDALASLDSSRTPAPWSSNPPALRRTPSSPGTGTPVRGDVPAASGREGGFADFQRRLEELAGRRLTVILQDGGEGERFTFEVPAAAGEK